MPWIKRLSLLFTLLFVSSAFAEWGEGWDPVDPPVPVTSKPGKVEVVEFFWYGCPHCYNLEPAMDAWRKKHQDDIDFHLIPAPLNPSWTPHAQFFYTAQALGLAKKLHKPLFDALHKEKRRLFDKQSLIDFAVEHGADRKAFTDTWNSFGVFVKVQQARKMGKRFQLTGVPAVGINGKYKTSGSLAGSYDKMFKVMDQLIARESQKSQANASSVQ